MIITGIHGAFSSSKAFNYVNDNSKHVWQFADYSDKTTGIEEITKEFKNKINADTILVGHSLGGVIASLLLEHKHVKGIITIASPLGGIYINRVVSVYMARNFVTELKQNGKVIRNVQNILDNTQKSVYHVITNNGYNPFLFKPNDGVIEIESQIMSPHNKIYLKSGHNEVMVTPELVRSIDIFIEKIQYGL